MTDLCARPTATLQRSETGGVLAALVRVQRRPGEGLNDFRLRLEGDFGVMDLEDTGTPEPIQGDEEAARTIYTAPPSKVVAFIRRPDGCLLGARLRPLKGTGTDLEVMRRLPSPGDLWTLHFHETLSSFGTRLERDHNAILTAEDRLDLTDPTPVRYDE